MVEKASPGRRKRTESTPELISIKALDMSPETFRDRLQKVGISTYQFADLSDITRARLRRVCEGDATSLVKRADGSLTVPRHFVIILLALEAGLLIKGEDSL